MLKGWISMLKMEIEKGIKIKDLALIVENTLVISDLHMGFEEAANKQGVLLPREQFEKTVGRLKSIIQGEKFDKVVILGDLKHEFGKTSETEWRNTLKLIDFLKKDCNTVILVKGNHDVNIDAIAKKKNVEVVETYKIGNVLFCHGHELLEDYEGAEIIVIGHEHPAISLREGIRVEKFKCFLKGKFEKKTLIVMPSFNLVTTGTDVLTERLLSPYLEQNLSEFEVYIVNEGNVLNFGRIKDLTNM
ncbi:metallophosphoesterase [Candidatus Woesearchaeota archaeon]|nr:MAG: metallophosphoesterase [Candidatus Woesearchaeota archaeon]